MSETPYEFKFERYGIQMRYVTEEDAPFVLELRTNKKLSRYLHETDPDLQKQIEWIRAYKQREREGREFYVLYSYKGEPFGLGRLYKIEGTSGTGGSWICRPGTPVEVVMASILAGRDSLFENAALEEEVFQVSKGNTHVIRMHKMFGAEITGENEHEYHFRLPREVYYRNRPKMLRLLGVT